MSSRYICPVCRSPRRASFSNQLGVSAHFRIALAVATVMVVTYFTAGSILAIKLSLLYLPIWAAWETWHWRRMRALSACRVCGFDPILYKTDWRAARSIVENRLGELKRMRDERNGTLAPGGAPGGARIHQSVSSPISLSRSGGASDKSHKPNPDSALASLNEK